MLGCIIRRGTLWYIDLLYYKFKWNRKDKIKKGKVFWDWSRALFWCGIDALENMFFTLNNPIEWEINTDANKYKSWWNGITENGSFR